MQIKSFWRHTIELLQSPFGIRPETFYSVNMNITDGKNIKRVVDSQVFGIPDIDQSIVAAPAVRMNHRIKRNLAANNVLQGFLLHIGNNLGINRTVSFINPKDNSFAARSAPALASDSSCSEVGFVNLDLAGGERRSAFTFFGDSISNFQINLINRLARQISQKSCFLSRQIKGEILDDLPCFSLANFSKPIIPFCCFISVAYHYQFIGLLL